MLKAETEPRRAFNLPEETDKVWDSVHRAEPPEETLYKLNTKEKEPLRAAPDELVKKPSKERRLGKANTEEANKSVDSRAT